MSIIAVIKKNPLLYRAADLARRSPWPLLRAIQRACHGLFGVDGRAVYFSSFGGSLYNDNPRAVAEALHEIAPDARIIFRLNRRGMAQGDIPDYVVRVPRRSLRGLRAMATSKVLVKNQQMQGWMLKFPDQFYVQLWHGERGFKRIRLDWPNPNPRFFRLYRREAKQLDLMVSGSDYATRNIHTAFDFHGEILECGCPRNDLLLKDPTGVAERVRSALGVPEGAKVLLYAPTFRFANAGGRQVAPLSLEKARACLEGATGGKWVCVTRSHELTRGMASDAALDASDWIEPGELLLATDLLITDYSSIAGDFMLLNRPAVFYQPDIDAYRGERGLYFDPDQSPLITAHTEAELLDILSRPIDGPANCQAVLDFLGAHETGRAAEAVAQRIAQELSMT